MNDLGYQHVRFAEVEYREVVDGPIGPEELSQVRVEVVLYTVSMPHALELVRNLKAVVAIGVGGDDALATSEEDEAALTRSQLRYLVKVAEDRGYARGYELGERDTTKRLKKAQQAQKVTKRGRWKKVR